MDKKSFIVILASIGLACLFLHFYDNLISIISDFNKDYYFYTNNEENEIDSNSIDSTKSIDCQLHTFDSLAIGNIKFGISEKEFEYQKKIFLSMHDALAGLKIKFMKGFYINQKLAALQIISEKSLKATNAWNDLYSQKYKTFDVVGKQVFIYEGESKIIMIKESRILNPIHQESW